MDTEISELSQAERRAMLALSRTKFMTPSEIGYAMTIGREYPLKGQGAGRVGGGMAKRLIDKGFVEDCSFKRGGFPAYRLTGKGRATLVSNEAGK